MHRLPLWAIDMRTRLTILSLLCITSIWAQEKRLNDVILFSPGGDTILMSGGASTNADKVTTTYWVVKARLESLDSIKTLSNWETISTDDFSLDSIPADTLKKYALVNEGSRINFDKQEDFKIMLKVNKTSRGRKTKNDPDTKIKSCKIDISVHFQNQLIWAKSEFRTMYFSLNDASIEPDQVVSLVGWKMQDQNKFVIVINWYTTIIKRNRKDERCHYKWLII